MQNKTVLNLKNVMLLCLILTYTVSLGHGGKEHKKSKKDSTHVETSDHSHEGSTDDHHEQAEDDHHAQEDHQHEHAQGSKALKADFNDFPTLHPLVVHFPIVLLLLAAISQIAGLFVFKNELSWVTLCLIAGGYIGAYVAGSYVHPHADGISEYAEKVLTEHENYASYATWFGGIGLFLKLVSHFLFKRKIWAEIVVAVVLVGAAYSVSTAGHYGAQLIHIEGIGAQGKFLETEGHEH